MKLLLYCTKGKLFLRKSIKDKDYYLDNGSEFNIIPKEDYVLNGKIVAECDFEVEDLKPCMSPIDMKPYAYMTRTLERWELTENSCLSFEQLDDYLKGYNGYAIHIKNLKIFDEPKELEYFESYKNDNYEVIEKAPQNMMYAYYITKTYADTFYEKPFVRYTYDKYILISIQPQWLCKILNNEKTIEIRKKVLREMIG